MEAIMEEREYRLITGGEDGTIMWWNLVAPYGYEEDQILEPVK